MLEEFAMNSDLTLFDAIPTGHPLRKITVYGELAENAPPKDSREHLALNPQIWTLSLMQPWRPGSSLAAFSNRHHFGRDVTLEWVDYDERPT